MSSSVHVDNKGKVILILGEGPTQVLDGTTFTAEAKYPINLLLSGKRFAIVYTIMKATVFCLLMLQKYINSKQKNSEIKDYAPCLGDVSKDFTINNMKKKQD